MFRLAAAGTRALDRGELEAIGDWHYVLQLAADENAVLGLRDHLRRATWHSVPPEVERCVAMLALDREFRMRLLRDRLEESLTALSGAGIKVMLLKGAALAASVYHSFADRPMRDVDILVRPERAEEARAVMIGLGWTADASLPGDRSYATHHHLPPLRDTAGSGMWLEIHRGLAPRGHPFRFTEEELWRAARGVEVGRAPVVVMHPLHHAVYLAIHFAWSHLLKTGAWHCFRDLGTLAAARLFDWDDLVGLASEWGASSCCYWTLRLAAKFSDLPVSDSTLERLWPRGPRILNGVLERHFRTGILRGDGACPSVRLDQLLWSVAMLPRRNGHAAVRPWSVSRELRTARAEAASAQHEAAPSFKIRKFRHSAQYLAELMG